METVAAVVVCAVALALGLVVGLRAPLRGPVVYLAGLAVGEVCAGVYLGLANMANRTWAGLLDAREVGMHFMILIVVAGLCGVLGSWFGYRKTFGRGLF